VEQSVSVAEERGANVYTITMPPGFLLCTNALGAMRLLNRGRTTVWSYVQQGLIRGFDIAGNVVIPLVDIANFMGVTETQVYNTALVYNLPIWQVKVE
jgi:hypothetical protein